MSKKIDIVVAYPSGNITIMVLTPIDRSDYKEVARKLLDMKELNGEQVAYILPPKTTETSNSTIGEQYPEMEMCGLEFCGNASRAFAYYTALNAPEKKEKTAVKVSGCDHPLTAKIDYQTGNIEMEMPIPVSYKLFSAKELSLQKDGILVNIDGISHLILQDIPPMYETFENLKDFIYENYDCNLPAFGVMFCDTVNDLMTPAVYVKDVDTTYFEGSCASGTVAASFALTKSMSDGIHNFKFEQPEGTLYSTVIKKQGRTEQILLKGIITLSEKITVEI